MAYEHVPVLLNEVISHFSPLEPGSLICDATFGGGGHTARLLELCSTCTLTAIDADPAMIERGRERFGGTERLLFRLGWFDEVLPTLVPHDRILMDLGISMMHMKEAGRGFALRENGPLDMRLNPQCGDPAADELLRRMSEREIADVLYHYGGERYSRRIARALTEQGVPDTTGGFADLVWRAVPPGYRRGRNHPATRSFQALRIAVNDELRRVERALPLAAARLRPGGRLGVITFHSLEDRIVKHGFRYLAGGGDTARDAGRVVHPLAGDSTQRADQPMYEDEGSFRVVTRKPVAPTEQEVAENAASRSAKLRVLERLAEEGE